jgi:putative ABC transport system permease protein
MAMKASVLNATLIGFGPAFLMFLIFGESMVICVIGGGFGLVLTPLAASGFKKAAGGIFPVFQVSNQTVLLQICCALLIGVAAAVVPALRAARVRIVDGLRAIG